MIEQSGVIEAPGLCYRNLNAVVTTAVGQMVHASPIASVVTELIFLFAMLFIFQVLLLRHEDMLNNSSSAKLLQS